MDIIIRSAFKADIISMTEIYKYNVENGTATYELTPPDFAEMSRRYDDNIRQGYPYLIAEDNEKILGYAYAAPFRTRPAYRWTVEDSIYLAPDAVNRGIGYQLLVALINRVEKLGFRQILAVIGDANPASIALHRKVGFADAGIMKATGYKHGKWLDTFIMQMTLGEGASTDPILTAYPGNL